MLFNSIHFAIFMIIVFFIYWKIPEKYRWILLLASSYYFYMCWNAKYIFLILGITIVSYIGAIIIDKADKQRIKSVTFITSIVICFGVLIYFKYFNFLIESMTWLVQKSGNKMNTIVIDIILPVGISFYIFQAVSYLIDVYQNKVKAEYHFGIYATFLSFFPQLVAGPIERTQHLLPQIKKQHIFLYEKASYGLKQVAWGLFKKIVIADTMAFYVNWIYGDLYKYTGSTLLICTVFFSIQIYCDFSGYSDIAIGVAKLLDVDLMSNFASPYLSGSVKQFWARWHISLSTWFKDYVYIPLGGNRCSKVKNAFNLFITFLLSGLWHGANWTFVCWGGLHGLAQIVEKTFIRKKRKAESIISIFLVFVFVNFAWVFFRADSFFDAWYIFSNIFKGITNPISYISQAHLDLHMDIFMFMKILFMIGILFSFDLLSKTKDVIATIGKMNIIKRWLIYSVFIFFLIFLLPVEQGQEFIYFQF